MIKEKVVKCIETHQLGLISGLEKELAEREKASDIDEHDVRDADAHSHQAQSEKDRERISEQLERAKADLEYLKKTPVTKSDTIAEGALIETRSLLMHVGIVTTKFTDEGRDIIGISVDAPIYKTLVGQKEGFPFQFAGIDCEIISIS